MAVSLSWQACYHYHVKKLPAAIIYCRKCVQCHCSHWVAGRICQPLIIMHHSALYYKNIEDYSNLMIYKHKETESWGRYPTVHTEKVVPVYWRDELPDLTTYNQSILPFAYGRSYGDSCLNENGIALDASHLRRFIAFDEQEGLLRCEAGLSLAEILEVIVPRGWFLPVTPGTKFISVGGAIANDVHGKNHHVAG